MVWPRVSCNWACHSDHCQWVIHSVWLSQRSDIILNRTSPITTTSTRAHTHPPSTEPLAYTINAKTHPSFPCSECYGHLPDASLGNHQGLSPSTDSHHKSYHSPPKLMKSIWVMTLMPTNGTTYHTILMPNLLWCLLFRKLNYTPFLLHWCRWCPKFTPSVTSP